MRFYRDLMPGLTLPYLAACIGPGHDISIHNEVVEPVDFDETADLVCITSITSRAPRGYQMAAEYRRRGVPVLMGGSHVALQPEEALEHVDAVVIGESEGLWEDILSDAASGELKRKYKLSSRPSLSGLPSPRYELVDRSKYWFPISSVQAVRGCPNNCEFCTVTRMYGGTFRYRPVKDVLADLEVSSPLVFFVDDNILSHRDYCLELFREMKPLRKLWYAQASLDEVADEEFLSLASDAGCVALYIGIESLDPVRRSRMGKGTAGFDSKDVIELMRMLRRYKVELLASMMIMDDDTAETVDETLEFLIRNNVAGLFLFILTPVPGSRLYERMEREDRIQSRDWSLYDGLHCVYEPLSMSKEELEAEFWRAQEKFYSTASILRRYLYPPHITLFLQNFVYQNSVRRRVHPMMGIYRPSLAGRMATSLMPAMELPGVRSLLRYMKLLK